MQALLLVTNKQQVDSSVESAECCTHFWTWKVRLPVAAQLHAEHHFTGKHFCILWFLTGSGLTAEAARQLESTKEQNLEHMSLEHEVLCCGMQWPRANVYNSLGGDGRLQKPLHLLAVTFDLRLLSKQLSG